MNPAQGIALGIVQGLTEFLPISSSGHLILARWLLDWDIPADAALKFDVALHMGTLLALLLFFWRDWCRLAQAVARGVLARITGQAASCSPAQRQDERLAWLLLAGTIPGGVAGAAGERFIQDHLREPLLVAVLMVSMGALLLVADWAARRARPLESIGLTDAVVIGASQALALAPGVSRSGITITTGRLFGFTREAAARFSFLLSTPLTAAAGLLQLQELARNGLSAADAAALFPGVASAAVVGMLAIGFLLRFLQRNSLAAFAYYRFVLGGLVLALILLGVKA
jgi:undecaprenyl-diphosphatase